MSSTDIQQQASDPANSVWLKAHAGTGKTKVLVDRILRLLLRGDEPSSILAITYTRAAASEMKERVLAHTARWLKADDATLKQALEQLTQDTATEALCQQARQLFSRLNQSEHGLNIQTIHSFCQKIITRFSIEAGMPSALQLLDERSGNQLFRQSWDEIHHAAEDVNAPLKAALEALNAMMAEETLIRAVKAVLTQRQSVLSLWHSRAETERYKALIYTICEAENRTDEQWLAEVLRQIPLNHQHLAAIIPCLLSSSKTDQQLAEKLQYWQQSPQSSLHDLQRLLACFFTQAGAPRAAIVTKTFEKAHPEKAQHLQQAQRWAVNVQRSISQRKTAQASTQLAELLHAFMAVYEARKAEKGWVDYADILIRCHHLLSTPGLCEWVMERLDARIQHLLLDEAQDTSPLQWQIIDLLVRDLFAVPHEHGRSLFVVGDHKQSIYRFQGADPSLFQHYERHFAGYLKDCGLPFISLTLDTSFRSVPEVLQLVDAVVALPQCQKALATTVTTHRPARALHHGEVKLLPPIMAEKQERPDVLSAHQQVLHGELSQIPSPMQQLCRQIAGEINVIISQQAFIPSKNRPANYGDIIILVRKRGRFVSMLTQTLLAAGIPVAGADRVSLTHLAVQDIMAIARWCVYPQDDLTLATILNGPLIAMPADEWAHHALMRGEQSLWGYLQSLEGNMADYVALLSQIQLDSLSFTPHEWLIRLLHRHGMYRALIRQFGAEVHDLVNLLLYQLEIFIANHPPSLSLFIQWLSEGEADARRDIGQHGQAVRIMTVHGAKGLQSPIVILADYSTHRSQHDPLVWLHYQALALPFLKVPGVALPEALAACKEQEDEQRREESQRLLYVALTRAEDALYLVAVQSGRTTPDWYQTVQQAMENLALSSPGAFGALTLAGSDSVLIAAPQKAKKPLPPALPKAFRVSDSAMHQSEEQHAGVALHRAFELLTEARGQKARVQGLWGREYPAGHPHHALLGLAEHFCQHPERSWLLDYPARNEMTFLYQGRQWRIDRLIDMPQGWLVVDYKMGQPTPEKQAHYQAQLENYCEIVRQTYPNRPVYALLIWVEVDTLQWVGNEMPQF